MPNPFMECPACHSINQTGQKFCGACGHKLERDCTQCGATNPPAFKFCGQCGYNLAASGQISLLRSGLIAEIDQNAAALLGHPKEEMAGKPFSLFVAREDLAVFFSHLNELIGTGEKQTVELALKHDKGQKIYVLIECTYQESLVPENRLIRLNLNDVSDRRLTLDRLQRQQDLLQLIYSLAERLHTVSPLHMNAVITEALKKICLFTTSDRCCIYNINRMQKRLDISHQWCQPSCSSSGSKIKSVPLVMIKRSIVRLRREHAYIVGDVSKLPPSERYELLAWHHADLAAVMCHLIYSRGRPVGIIGLAKNQAACQWPADCIALVRLFGQMVGDLLPFDENKKPSAGPDKSIETKNPRPLRAAEGKMPANAPAGNGDDRLYGSKIVSHPQGVANSDRKPPPAAVMPLPDFGKPMQFEKITGDHRLDQQTVSLRDDGLVLITCPYCGIQESVTMAKFEKLGNAIQVLCTCNKQFAVVLEKRRACRKSVRLEGYFTIAGEYGPNDTKGSIWGPMVVKNLSKTGLRFLSKRVDLVRAGDYLMVRFNLDNSNQALIHKKVQVISIQGHEVGCRFKGVDQYDITLGFYFI